MFRNVFDLATKYYGYVFRDKRYYTVSVATTVYGILNEASILTVYVECRSKLTSRVIGDTDITSTLLIRRAALISPCVDYFTSRAIIANQINSLQSLARPHHDSLSFRNEPAFDNSVYRPQSGIDRVLALLSAHWANSQSVSEWENDNILLLKA